MPTASVDQYPADPSPPTRRIHVQRPDLASIRDVCISRLANGHMSAYGFAIDGNHGARAVRITKPVSACAVFRTQGIQIVLIDKSAIALLPGSDMDLRNSHRVIDHRFAYTNHHSSIGSSTRLSPPLFDANA